MHLATTPKPIIHLGELAEVNAAAPVAIRRRTPLDVLKNHLYGLAFRKPNLIEEVELVYRDEERRRQQQPTMRIVR
jgi:hypothetical protein